MLAELDANEVGQIMPLLHAHNMPPHVEVLAEGAEANAMYFIATGKVKRVHTGGEQVFGTGEFFGAVAMLDNDVHTGAFITTAKCRLLKLHKEDFHRLETSNPQVATNIRKTAAARRAARDAVAAATKATSGTAT